LDRDINLTSLVPPFLRTGALVGCEAVALACRGWGEGYLGDLSVIITASAVPAFDALNVSIEGNSIEERPVAPRPPPQRQTQASRIKGGVSAFRGVSSPEVDGESIAFVSRQAGFY
jgi:hypothetical protein